MSSKPVVLVGLPGSGKTTLSKALHDLLGWSWVDVDGVVESEVSCSVSELIRVEGEQKFRAHEASVLAQAIRSSAQIISVGGGAMSHAESRELITKETLPIHLLVSFDEGAKRVLHDELQDSDTTRSKHAKRPLLFKQGFELNESVAIHRLRELNKAREMHYALAPMRLSTEFADAERIAMVLSEEMQAQEHKQTSIIPDPMTRIVIEAGVIESLGQRVRVYFPKAEKLALLVDANVNRLYGKTAMESCRESCSKMGFNVLLLEVPSGEQSKSGQQFLTFLESLAEHELSRDDVLVAIGGGVVGDVAGFVASVYMRGIPHVQVPTTLVAQVDSAIGGKNAVNLPQGKNLVGTFHPPHAVLSDTSLLSSLPEREYFSGMAEVIKYGLIFSEEFFVWLESKVLEIKQRDTSVLSRIVEQSSLFKTRVVVEDLYDRLGLRAKLNFGHTVGHAIEKLAGYGEFLHGEAVAVGMLEALYVGETLQVTPVGILPRVALLLQAFGLPTAVPKSLLQGADEYAEARGISSTADPRAQVVRAEKKGKPSSEQTMEGLPVSTMSASAKKFSDIWQKALRADKKRGAEGLKFILLDQIGSAKVMPVEVVKAVDCIAVRSISK